MVEDSEKHLVIICPECAGSGAVANVALHHCLELSSKYRVTLLSNNAPPLDNSFDFLQLKPMSFDFLRRYSHVPREVAFARVALKALYKLHKNKPIDSVMCHGHVVAAMAAKKFKKRTKVPYVMVTHGDIFDRPKGTYDQRLTWLYEKVTPKAYKHANLVVALSPHMQEMAIRGSAQSEQIVIIPNGVDALDIGLDKELLQNQIQPQHMGFELLFVGRLSVEKGVDILLGASSKLVEQGIQFRLRICGSGPEEARLRQQVQTLNLSEHVQFIGQVPRRKMGALYRSAHYVCVPSKSDPLPTVVLEALLSGTPVVGADVGGIPFSIEPNVTGYLFAAGDSEALTRQLSFCQDSLDKLPALRDNCRQVALQRFSWAKTGQRLIDDLKNV